MPGRIGRKPNTTSIPSPPALEAATPPSPQTSLRPAGAPAVPPTEAYRTARPDATASHRSEPAATAVDMRRRRREIKAHKWANYDSQTVIHDRPEGPVVDHGASAVANLKETGRNILNAFDPKNHFRDSYMGSYPMGFAIEFLMLPWRVMGEFFDVVVAPFAVVKNLSDAAAHGVMAGVSKLKGEE